MDESVADELEVPSGPHSLQRPEKDAMWYFTPCISTIARLTKCFSSLTQSGFKCADRGTTG